MPIDAGRRGGEPLLSFSGVWKYYGETAVVQDATGELRAGEVLGFLGPNGAGKTTLVGMLYGFVLPSKGEIRAGEWSLPREARHARSNMGIVTQDDNLDPDFSAEENLFWFCLHYGIRSTAARQRIAELLEQVGLTEHRTKKVDELSGGLKRRLVLARSLIHRPRIVFLDEPTTGLDPDSRQDFWRLVGSLRESGCGVVLTTHYMDEAYRLCDRLVLIQKGCKVDEAPPEELVRRIAGHHVLEVDGVREGDIRAYCERLGTWTRPFGSGYIIALPESGTDEHHLHVQAMENHGADRVSIRRANLEDVFLKLTGEGLG